MPTTIDDIEEMDDLYEIMKSFGLSTKGIKGVDGMKAKCREYLKDLEGSSKRKVGEVSMNRQCTLGRFIEEIRLNTKQHAR